MSLLEDVFLQDEADEAQDLERVIEGDEYEEIRRQGSSDEDDGGAGREDEAEEDRRRVDPNTTKTKRVVKNPRFVLNPARLTGPRGIHIIPEHFKDFKFKGKGHEKEDLDLVLKKLEHWAYRLYPKYKFADCLKKIETLGKKRAVMVNLHKIRTDQFANEEAIIQKDSSDEETEPVVQEEDEFDKLLQQQIEMARNTPARPALKKDISTPFAMPKATSSPSISEEQKQRMMENRRKAEERRLARLNQTVNNENVEPNAIIKETESTKEHNESNEINYSSNETPMKDANMEVDLTETNGKSIGSDEDNGTDVLRNENTESVDLTKGNERKNKSKVIDSSDDESTSTKDKGFKTDRKPRNPVISSSDEE